MVEVLLNLADLEVATDLLEQCLHAAGNRSLVDIALDESEGPLVDFNGSLDVLVEALRILEHLGELPETLWVLWSDVRNYTVCDKSLIKLSVPVVEVTNLLDQPALLQAKIICLFEAHVGLSEPLRASRQTEDCHQAPYLRISVVKHIGLRDGVLRFLELTQTEQAQSKIKPAGGANAFLATLEEDSLSIPPSLPLGVDYAQSLL